MNAYHRVLLVLMCLCLGYSTRAYSTFYMGAQVHPALLINTSAKNNYESPAWGGSIHVFYSPEFFLGDFLALGLRQSYTHFNSKVSASAGDANSFDTLLAGRVAVLDKPFEDWTWDFVLEAGFNYFEPKTNGVSSSSHFTYALGTGFRYFLFSESALGAFARWHQTLGNFTVASGTSMTNLSLIELGLFFEFSI